jgi:hypothetical protein
VNRSRSCRGYLRARIVTKRGRPSNRDDDRDENDRQGDRHHHREDPRSASPRAKLFGVGRDADPFIRRWGDDRSDLSAGMEVGVFLLDDRTEILGQRRRRRNRDRWCELRSHSQHRRVRDRLRDRDIIGWRDFGLGEDVDLVGSVCDRIVSPKTGIDRSHAIGDVLHAPEVLPHSLTKRRSRGRLAQPTGDQTTLLLRKNLISLYRAVGRCGRMSSLWSLKLPIEILVPGKRVVED